MNTAKLKEALVELKHQRAMLDGAISNLESILRALNGSGTAAPVERHAETESYIDLTVRILEESGKPMHVSDIAKRISEIREKNVPRPSVESSLLRHMKVSRVRPRIVKVRPAYFGLPEWKNLFSNSREPQHTAA